jgi:sugar-specific transcriptional regulator TrmB
MDRNRLIEELRELSMTQYQAHAYVAAVSLGESRPGELSEAADVPQARIYDVIDSLDEMGLIEKQSRGSGTVVSVPDPDIVLNEYKQRHFDDFGSKIQSVSAGLSTLYSRESDSEGFVTLVRTESSALRHIRQAIEDADWWLTLAISSDTYAEVADELAAAVDRGVTVRLILGDDPTGDSELDFPERMRVRHRGISDTLVAADRSYGVFSSTYPSTDPQPYIVSQEVNLVLFFQCYVEQIWPTSAVIQEGDVGEARWYLDPWRVILDFRDELRSEDLSVRIIGHRTEDQFRSEWEGKIIDYEISGPVENSYESALPVVATLTVDVDGEVMTSGGWKATAEDLAAHAIEVRS